MPRSEERGGMAARSEAEINSLLVYKSPARKGGVLYWRGKRYQETSGSVLRMEAVKLLRRRMAEMGKGQLRGPDLEKTISLELTTGQTIPTVFHWNDKGTIKPIHQKVLYHRWKEACRLAGVPKRIPHDFRRTAVRSLDWLGVPHSVVMKLTGHKTEAVYRHYAIVCEANLSEGLRKLAVLEDSLRGEITAV